LKNVTLQFLYEYHDRKGGMNLRSLVYNETKGWGDAGNQNYGNSKNVIMMSEDMVK